MIQDLGEKKLYNEFEEIEAGEQDNVFCFDGDKILGIKVPGRNFDCSKGSRFCRT